jgi:uncharacterized protein YggU (UPF0235/DUF167 family)
MEFSNRIIEIEARLNSKKNDIIKEKNKIIIYVKAKPENNKANNEIEQYLTKITGKSAKIIKGKTKRKKTIKLI